MNPARRWPEVAKELRKDAVIAFKRSIDDNQIGFDDAFHRFVELAEEWRVGVEIGQENRTTALLYLTACLKELESKEKITLT